MADLSEILSLLKIIIFGLNIIIALLYTMSMLLIRHLHNRINILTINICVSMIFISIYFLVYFLMYEYYIEYLFTDKTCTFLFYIQSIIVCETPLALVTLTVNRYFMIKYHTKQFFKTKKFMAICIGSQRIIECLLSLPFILYIQSDCNIPQWVYMYSVIIAIIIPSLISLIINLGIFQHVRSSSQRIQPQTATTTTGTVIIHQQTRINRRDLYLLRHTIFIFSVFIIGWTPIFSLLAIDYDGYVSPIVYLLLQILSVICSFVCMLDLFLYNHQLRRYIKDKFLQCF